MKKLLVRVSFLLLLLVAVKSASANPSPGFEHDFLDYYWFIKTAPVNYCVDLLALALGLFLTRQVYKESWRYLPLYNIMTFAAGYTSDFLAKHAVSASFAIVTSREPIAGIFTFGYDRVLTASQSIQFMALATILIFAFNCLIVTIILKLNDADDYSRVPLAAGTIAVLTAPYLSVKISSTFALFIPSLMALVVSVVVILAKNGWKTGGILARIRK